MLPSAAQARQEALYLVDRAEYELRGGVPVTHLGIVGPAHEDPDSAVPKRPERVFVGDVVAEVQREHVVAAESEHVDQMQHRLTLVPVDVGLELVDHLPGREGDSVGVLGEQGLHAVADAVAVLGGNVAIVHRHRGPLGFDLHPGDRTHVFTKAVGHLGDEVEEPGHAIVADRALLRGPDVEAVAARHDQIVDTHQLLRHGAVAAGDDADRASGCQHPQRDSHVIGHHGVLGAVHDRCQHSVVVEEDRRLVSRQSPLDRPALAEG